MSELDDYKAAIEAEYGQFVAVAPIFHDGVRAYNPGSRVPASNVALYGYDKDGLVEAVDSSPAAAPAATPSPSPSPAPGVNADLKG